MKASMPENDVPESPEERMQRRRARRWKRRARMAGPFLGLPVLLGSLALSVDLIEYEPQSPSNRLADRPLSIEEPETTRTNPIPMERSVSSASIVSPIPTPTQNPALDLSLSGSDLDPVPRTRELAPPTPPYALQPRR